MAKYHVDRDVSYMRQMWGTTSLITDYKSLNFGRFTAALKAPERKKPKGEENDANAGK